MGYKAWGPMMGKSMRVLMKTGFGVHDNAGGKGQKCRPSAGQMNQVYCARIAGKKNENIIVKTTAPMNPSQVLLGDSAKKGAVMNFFPNVMPEK